MGFDPSVWRQIVDRDVAWAPRSLDAVWSGVEIDAYEDRIGFVLPLGYRWVLDLYPGLVLAPRWLRRAGQDYPWDLASDTAGLWGPFVADWYFEHALGGGEYAPEILAWERQLFSCVLCNATETGTSLLALDFTFDPSDPPVVEIQVADRWAEDVESASAGRFEGLPSVMSGGKVAFVADRFDVFFEAPHIIADEPSATPQEPTRGQSWVQWRNDLLVEVGAAWWAEEQNRRFRNANPTLEDLRDSVDRALLDIEAGGQFAYNRLGLAKERLGERLGEPERVAEALRWYERGIAEGDRAAEINLARLQEHLRSRN